MFNLKDVVKSWDKFFFTEKPTEGIALFRILWIGVIIIYYLLDIYNIDDFYGPHAIISLKTVRDQFPYIHANLFHLFNSGYGVTYFLYAIYGVFLLTSFLGLMTRSSLVMVLICMTSFHQRNIWLLCSSELLMRSITLLLIFSPCGHSLSLDSLISKHYYQEKLKTEWSVWVLRLIQIQISVVYVWTVWHKLKGQTWIDGSAVYYATRLEEMANFSIPFVLNSKIFLKFMTWGTLLFELSFGILVWFKEFRIQVILIAIAFHLGIEYMMSIPFFEWYMIILLLNFFTPEEHKKFITMLRGLFDVSLNNLKEKILESKGNHNEVS